MCRESLVSHLLILLISQAAGRSPSQNRSAMAIHLFSLPAFSHGRRLMKSPNTLPGFGLFSFAFLQFYFCFFQKKLAP